MGKIMDKVCKFRPLFNEVMWTWEYFRCYPYREVGIKNDIIRVVPEDGVPRRRSILGSGTKYKKNFGWKRLFQDNKEGHGKELFDGLQIPPIFESLLTKKCKQKRKLFDWLLYAPVGFKSNDVTRKRC